MPQREDRNILQVQPVKDVKDAKDLKEYQEKFSVQFKEYERRVNEVIRRLSDNIVKLEGRTGEINSKNALSITSDTPTLINFEDHGVISHDDVHVPRTLELAGGAFRDTDGQWVATDQGAAILQLASDGSFKIYSNTGLTPKAAFTPTAVNTASFIGAKAYRTTNQSINDVTSTPVSWSAVMWDSSGFWAAGSPTRFTIPAGLGGYYLIQGQVSMGANTTRFLIQPELNSAGTSNNNNALARVDTQGDLSANVSVIKQLAAGDHIELYAFQDSAGAQNITPLGAGGVVGSPWFSLFRLGS